MFSMFFCWLLLCNNSMIKTNLKEKKISEKNVKKKYSSQLADNVMFYMCSKYLNINFSNIDLMYHL